MWTFRAMNTDVSVAAPHLDEVAQRALATSIAALFADTEERFSRFREDSELSRLNSATKAITVSREMLDALVAARAHVAATAGLFDPAIGGALASAGYDRSFAPGVLDREVARTPPPARFDDVIIDEQARGVVRPSHVQLDFGGFLKGRTVDRAAALAPAVAMIDAGGDIVLRGDGPDGAGWLVEIEDPEDDQRIVATLRLADRAVATSAPNRRRWRVGDTRAHHLIDPRTRAPAASDLAQVTVVAPAAEQADVLAKVTFVLGADAGSRWLARWPHVGGVLVLADGSTRTVGEVTYA